jgi:hypothetical protein
MRLLTYELQNMYGVPKKDTIDVNIYCSSLYARLEMVSGSIFDIVYNTLTCTILYSAYI